MRKRLLAAALTGSLFLSAFGTIRTAAADDLILAAGDPTGTYYAVGNVLKIVLDRVLDNIKLEVIATGASKANIQLIDDEDADLAIAQNDVMYYAYTGTDLFEEEGAYDTFAAVAGLYDETVQIITCSKDIKSVTDLKGKTVCVGDAGSGTEFNAKQILAAYDLTFDDIKVENASFSSVVESLKDGTTDAAFIVAGTPTNAVADLAAVKAVKLVEIDNEHIEKLKKKYSFYTSTTIGADTYEGLDADVETVSVRATLIASVNADEDQVYEILSAMFDNKDFLTEGNAKFGQLSPESAVDGISVPFHEGAKKNYEEQGITVE